MQLELCQGISISTIYCGMRTKHGKHTWEFLVGAHTDSCSYIVDYEQASTWLQSKESSFRPTWELEKWGLRGWAWRDGELWRSSGGDNMPPGGELVPYRSFEWLDDDSSSDSEDSVDSD